MKYKSALLIGRFQPFHLGHLYLVKKALEVAENLVIGIGSSNIFDGNNPLDWRTREKILKAVFYKENIENRISKIIPLDDFFNDEKWLKNVKEKALPFDIVIGNNQWVNGIMEKGGYDVLRVPYYKRFLYEGEKIRNLLVKRGDWQARVPKYLVGFIKDNLTAHIDHVVVGGTFDHFHKGHRAMIDKAFTVGKKVTIGIATEELYKDKLLSNKIESFSVRIKSVSDYLASKKWISRAKLIPFSIFKGPLDKKKNVSAIVVSNQTFPNALKINQMREINKLPPLRTIMVPDVLAQDGKLISSERIRRGEIDREGNLYMKLFVNSLKMPESLRLKLRNPLGSVVKGKLEDEAKVSKKIAVLIAKIQPAMVIAVGDIIAGSLEKNGTIPDIKIIDLKSRRQAIDTKKNKSKDIRILNEAGTINSQAVLEIKKAVDANITGKKPLEVVVEGEEDLLTLTAILLAPLGSVVLYGHWQLGAIYVIVEEQTKAHVSGLIRKFH